MEVTAGLRFTPQRQIGGPQGRNSTVWVAQDHQLNAEIAVKQVERAKCATPAEYFEEAKRLYLVRHSNVVDVKYACETPDHIWLAMPHYTEGSLHSLLESRYLTVREIIKLGLDFMAGLHHVHVKRLVHLDVKPTNVLIGSNFTAALADFGASQHLDQNGLAPTGSLYDKHLPPEALQVSQTGTHSDIYQAGLTLYRMCNGLSAFEKQLPPNPSALDDAIVRGKFPDRNEFLPHIPGSLRRIIKKALNVEPAKRYATVLDLMNQLAAVDEQLDWMYTEDIASLTQTWTSPAGTPQGTYDKIVKVVDGGGSRDVIFTRRNRVSGRESKIAALTKTGLVKSEVRPWLEQVLAGI
jgi:serine/threonine protein kinase